MRLFLAGIWISLAACSPRIRDASPPQVIAPRQFAAGPGTSVTNAVDAGVVKVTGVPGSSGSISGRVEIPQRASFDFSELHGVVITSHYQGPAAPATPPVQLAVEVPQGVSLTLRTKSAAVDIQDTRGFLKVDTLSGSLSLNDVSGSVRLNSAQAAVQVSGGSGSLAIAGQSGDLHLDGWDGELSAMTILADIDYRGSPAGGQPVSLESDEGSITVELGKESNVHVQTETVQGGITCLIEGFSWFFGRCEGTIGSGAGLFKIRTVYGSIRLDNLQP